MGKAKQMAYFQPSYLMQYTQTPHQAMALGSVIPLQVKPVQAKEMAVGRTAAVAVKAVVVGKGDDVPKK